MSQILTIELPDDVYAPLAAEATATGKTVAEVAAARLAGGGLTKPGEGLKNICGVVDSGPHNGAPVKPGELLQKYAGSFNFGELTDVSVRHHEYLGQAYLEELGGATGE